MKKKKTVIIVGIGIVIILLIVALSRRQVKEVGTPIVGITPTQRRRLPIRFDLPQPKSVRWDVDGSDLPAEANRVTVNFETINTQTRSGLLEMVGMEEADRIGSDDDRWLYSDGGVRSAYFDLANHKFSYTEAIEDMSQITEKGKNEVGDIEDKISKILNIKGVEIRTASKTFKRIVNPRWVITTEDKAQAVEIGMGYYVDNYPLLQFTGEPIMVLVSPVGKILKMEVNIIRGVESGPKISLSGMDDIKKTGADGVWLWKSRLEEGEEVDEVVIRMIEMRYLYNSEGVVGEYWIGSGTGIVGKKPVTMSVIVPAAK